MTTLITRLFADDSIAAKASDALQAGGIDEDAIRAIGGSDAATAMADVGLGEDAVAAYSGAMSGSNTLVAIRAPFGTTGRALTALKKFDAIDVGLESQEAHISAQDDPEMQSSIIKGNKKFLTGKGVTESRYISPFGFPLLSKNQRGKAKVDTKPVLSSKLGWRTTKPPKAGKRVLSDNPTPLSSMIGMSLIKKPRLRNSVMSDNPTPFSSALGWPTIIK